jgi:hypothetical protein
MTFHEFKNGMSVMDGNRCVASAKPTRGHGWMLIARASSWVDIRARTQGLMPGKYPNLMLVKDRREARAHLSKLASA